MKKNIESSKAVFYGVLAGILFLFSLTATAQAQIGTVEIQNNNDFGINIYTQSFDRFGRPFWRRIGGIPPQKRQVFPQVPNGVLFGANNSRLNRNFPPQRVFFGPKRFRRIIFPELRKRR